MKYLLSRLLLGAAGLSLVTPMLASEKYLINNNQHLDWSQLLGSNDTTSSCPRWDCIVCNSCCHKMSKIEASNISTIYTDFNVDGIGSTAQMIVFATSFARQLGVKWGGMFRKNCAFFSEVIHGVHRDFPLEFLFGDAYKVAHDAKGPFKNQNQQIQMIELNQLTQMDMNQYPGMFTDQKGYTTPEAMMVSFLKLKNDLKQQPGKYLLPKKLESPRELYSDFFNKEYLKELRNGAKCGVNTVLQKTCYFQYIYDYHDIKKIDNKEEEEDTSDENQVKNENKMMKQQNEIIKTKRKTINIAGHFRRGDTVATGSNNKNWFLRYTDEDYYLNIFDAINLAVIKHWDGLVKVDMHHFTSCTWDCNMTHSLIEKFKNHSVTLHVDDEKEDDATYDILVAWAHFIKADIFITSRSSFSHSVAIFNPNCVVYQPMWHGELEGWIVINETIVNRRPHEDHSCRGLCPNELANFFMNSLSTCIVDW
mmetsp:Transcript_30985/g.39884  ORF Transcript_30985/g.39884 Transcript_30985/m.39884 type:complete len:478 (+) Transcript_30985:101-1534(+)